MSCVKLTAAVFLILVSGSVRAEESLTWGIGARLTNRYDKAYRWIDNGRLVLTDHFRTDLVIDAQTKQLRIVNGFGRIIMTKYWNSWLMENQPANGAYNLNTDDKYKNDTVHVQQAYMTYVPVPWFTLMGGRLPTVDGSPVNYYRDNLSTAIFPKLALGGELDGGLCTFTWDSLLPSNQHLQWHLAYTPFLLENYNNQTTPSTAKPLVAAGTLEAETLGPMAMTGLDYVFDGSTHFQFLRAGFHYRWMNYLRFPDSTVGPDTTTSNLAISLRAFTFYGEVNQLAGWPLDISATFLSTILSSDGTVTVTAGPDAARNWGGFGTSKSSDILYGNRILFAARYRSPFHSLYDPILGLEYLLGTQDSFYFDRNPEDVTQFYATKGQAYHLYIAEPLDKNFTVRVGLRRQEYAYTPTALGDTFPDHTKYDTYYADFRAEF